MCMALYLCNSLYMYFLCQRKRRLTNKQNKKRLDSNHAAPFLKTLKKGD
jgi:hypothetical protein